MKTDRILQGLLAVMLAVFCFTLYKSLHEVIVSAGDTAPSFSIKTADGKTVTERDFGGKLLLLNFWASWCAPCVEEIPDLNSMASQLGPKGLVILGVSVDKDEKALQTFVGKTPLAYPYARDPDQTINLDYGTHLFPESYLIDKNGKVVEKFINSQPWASPEMIQHVQSML